MHLKKSKAVIHSIPVLTDNIIWVWVFSDEAIVIDPALVDPVQSWLETHKLKLKAILQTHHHSDHIGGTPGLINLWPNAEVIASRNDINRIPFQTISVKDKDKIWLLDTSVDVIEVSGHTNNHIAFFISDENENISSPKLFCGDTLFSGGCGRLFEGSAEDMFNSLKKLKELPENTQIYCAHEYTESNLKWAHSLHPNNLAIKDKLFDVIKKRSEGLSTLPTTIGLEKEINLFLQARTIKEFAELRNNKDCW